MNCKLLPSCHLKKWTAWSSILEVWMNAMIRDIDMLFVNGLQRMCHTTSKIKCGRKSSTVFMPSLQIIRRAWWSIKKGAIDQAQWNPLDINTHVHPKGSDEDKNSDEKTHSTEENGDVENPVSRAAGTNTKKRLDIEVEDGQPSSKKRKTSLENSDKFNVSSIHLEGRESDSPVYETCDMVREKIEEHIKKPGVKISSFVLALQNQYHDPSSMEHMTNNSLYSFRRKSGYATGNTSTAFYAAYCFFEKLRIKQRGRRVGIGRRWKNCGRRREDLIWWHCLRVRELRVWWVRNLRVIGLVAVRSMAFWQVTLDRKSRGPTFRCELIVFTENFPGKMISNWFKTNFPTKPGYLWEKPGSCVLNFRYIPYFARIEVFKLYLLFPCCPCLPL